ncbi:MAG: HesA/MoeB/ThiF family protein [Firmicutes bacterium]|nr:HesA/MoeB/ThiF family protein [Bacillota bacterium]
MDLDTTAREMYSRQIMMKEIGEAGQRRLAAASVFVAGCGGLGSPVLYYLAAMGIGHLGLCDGDTVSLSNLNRQFLYTVEDLGKPKAVTAQKRLQALNPRLQITVYDRFLDEALAAAALPAYDIAVDCLDNYEGRFVLNDACVAAGKAFVHAGIGEFYGQMMTVTPGAGPCLRCLFPHGRGKKEQAEQIGAVGATAGVLGAMQATEVLKYLLGLPVCNDGLAVYDGLEMRLEKITLAASPSCVCAR